MRRLAAVAIAAVLAIVPAWGQHAGGGGHAGSAGHAASAPHGGFSSAPRGGFSSAPRGGFSGAPAYRRPAGAPGYAARPQFGARPQAMAPGMRGSGAGSPLGRVSNTRDAHHRRTYVSFRSGYGYPYANGWSIFPGYPTVLDYGDYGDEGDNGQDQGPVYYDNGDNGYDNGAYGDLGQQPPSWPTMGPYAPGAGAQPGAQNATHPGEQAVTIIFKDGRPPQQIHNYVLTQSALFVGDARGVTIPLDAIDLPATVKANQDAGVDFRLPKALN